MVGTLQVVDGSRTFVIELLVFTETAEGVEYRLLHFTPSLTPWEPAVLTLASIDPRNIVFQNPSDGQPQQVIFTRVDPDTYTNRLEIIPTSGSAQTNDITFHRQKPSSQKSSGGSAAHR